ncbi:MAG: hypothetical protein KatS3mg057_2527 [Herpetosiphonaceae bacterium]|nr:MAG: hypothetical protein KatS3mg057_2527 [Herpetosiphonaceae bacterium]
MPILVFDALLLSVPILLSLLGVGRGGTREAVTLIGILGGALLGALWREPWGVALARSMAQDQRLMQAVVFDMLLLGTTILIGYGGALLLPPRQRILRLPGSRLAGGLLGALNGLLLVGLLLWSAAEAGSRGISGIVTGTRLGALIGNRLPLLLLVLTAAVAVLIVLTLLRRFLTLLRRANTPGAAHPSPYGRAGSSPSTTSRQPNVRTGAGASASTSWPTPAPGKVERMLDPLDEARRIKEEGYKPPQDHR